MRKGAGLILMFLVLLTNCTRKKDGSGVQKPIALKTAKTVNWVGHWKGEGSKEKLVKEIYREFSFENPEINVNLVFPQDSKTGNSSSDYIVAQLRAPKSDWDILWINDNYGPISEIMKEDNWPSKYLVDFMQYPEFVNAYASTQVLNNAKKKWNGIVPGPGIDGISYMLWCNDAVAKKIGIEPKQFDNTPSDLKTYFKAVNDYNTKNNTDIIPLLVDNEGWSPRNVLMQQLFASQVNDTTLLNNSTFGSEKFDAWKAVINALEELSQYKPLPAEWRKKTWSEATKDAISGKCLFYVHASYMYNLWYTSDSAATKNMYPVELPSLKPAQSYISEYRIPWAIPKNSPNRDEAIKLLLYWCRPSVADRWVRYTKSPSPIKGNFVNSTFSKDKFEAFDFMINKKYGNSKYNLGGNEYYFGPNHAGVNPYFFEVLEGSVSAKEAISIVGRKLGRN